jgi:hypothetical protein
MGFCGKQGCARIFAGLRLATIFDATACGSRRYFSGLSMFSPLPTLTHEWIASTHSHPSDCVLVLHVVTRGEYGSSCRELSFL